MGSIPGALAQNFYTGPAAGDWDNQANWSGEVPGADDDVVVDDRVQESAVTIGTSRTRSVSTLRVDAGDSVTVSNNSSLNVTGASLEIDGELLINSAGSGTELSIGTATALTGSGSVILGAGSDNNRIWGGGTLTNSATIAGRGNVGFNQLALVNEAGGLVDASINLFMDPRAGEGMINRGTMQSSGGGTLQLSGFGGGGFDNASGTIQALGPGSEVLLRGSASVVGGTLHTEDGGLIRGNVSDNYFFQDVTFDSGTQVRGENNSDFGVNGTITNDGTITMFSVGSGTDIELQDDTSFLGSGEVVLANNFNARINGSGTLTNGVDHTIRGRGQLGMDVISLVNDGLVSADVDDTTLLINPAAGGLINNGTLEAVGGGILQLFGTVGAFDNTDGEVQAIGAGSEVQLTNDAFLFGGVLRSANGGIIRGNASQNYFFRDVAIEGGTQVRGENNSDFGVGGTITNDGAITIFSLGSATDIELQDDTSFLGTGEVVLANNFNARINGEGTLTNGAGHTIRGRGQIGVDVISLVNDGFVSADVDEATLLINPALGGVINNGTLEAVGGGILQLFGTGGAFDNTNGEVQALGDGSEVQLTNGASLFGGVLRTAEGSLIRGNASQNYFFQDVTFGSGTQVLGENNSDFGVNGTITNNGTITMFSTGSGTDIELQDDTVFNGTGEVVLAQHFNARINGSGTLTNGADHTIRGLGQIGVNAISLINDGLVSADVTGATLLINPATANGVVNNGTLEAVGGGILQLFGTGGGFDNGDGVVQAVGAGSEVQLTNGASLVGGTLHSEGGGLIRGNASQDYFFRDVTIDEGTQLRGENNSDFGVSGTITNDGTVTIFSTGSSTDLQLQSETVFLGTGEVVLANHPNARITGSGVFTNGAGHTIRGRGQIGVNDLSVFNAAGATIDADVDGAGLFLDPVAGAGTFDNRGLLTASNGGILQLAGNGGGTFDNSGGTVRAGEDSEVRFLNFVSLSGGVLESEGTGIFRLPVSERATLADLEIAGNVTTENNSELTLSGAISHSGEMTINPGGSNTDLSIDSILDLEGGGSITMTGNNARIVGNGVLINRDHVIQGAGQIGANQSAATNTAGGTIHANLAGGTMNLDPNAVLGFVNDGTLRASSGGTLNLSGSGGGQFTFGETSVVEALDGGSITNSSGAVLTNLQDGVLSAGRYRVVDEGSGASLSLPGGDITTNAAAIELSGSAAQFSQLGTLSENDGTLSVANGASVEVSGDLAQTAAGILEVDISGKPAESGLWGRLVAAGEVALDGVLNLFVNVGNTFAAAIGDAWQIVTGSMRDGEFAELNVTTGELPAGSRVKVDYNDEGVEVAVVSEAEPLLARATYEDWLTAQGLHRRLDPLGDSDGDGASNLHEYAFGMDPWAHDHWLMPRVDVVREEGASFVSITYHRPVGPGYPNDVTYTVESSHDLKTWTTSGIMIGTPVAMGETGLEQISARLQQAIGSGASSGYLRVSLRLEE